MKLTIGSTQTATIGFFFLIQGLLGAILSAETPEKSNEDRKWSVMFLIARSSETVLGQLLMGNFVDSKETLYSFEVAYTLDKENRVRKFFSPYVHSVELASNLTRRHGSKNGRTISEGNLYLIFRWNKFPWNNHIPTSLAIGEGISYVSSIPVDERKSTTGTKSLLNYLMFEATFSPPKREHIQLVVRVHHRSGAFGLYGAKNTGSNAVGVGLRYKF